MRSTIRGPHSGLAYGTRTGSAWASVSLPVASGAVRLANNASATAALGCANARARRLSGIFRPKAKSASSSFASGLTWLAGVGRAAPATGVGIGRAAAAQSIIWPSRLGQAGHSQNGRLPGGGSPLTVSAIATTRPLP